MTWFRYNFRWPVLAVVLMASGVVRVEVLDKPTTSGSVTIQFPKGWMVKGLVASGPEDKDASGAYQANLSIKSEAGEAVDLAKLQERLGKVMTNYKSVEEPKPITINGLQGIVLGGTFTPVGGLPKLRVRQYIFLFNNRNYFINFICLESRWDTYRPTVEASVATLGLKK